MPPIPILSSDPYVVSTVFLLGVSSTSIAAYMSARWLTRVRVGYYSVYAIVLGCLCVVGRLIFHPSLFPVVAVHPVNQASFALLGSMLGIGLSRLGQQLARHNRTISQQRKPAEKRRPIGDSPLLRAKKSSFQRPSNQPHRKPGNTGLDDCLREKINVQSVGLVTLLLIALGEEVLYRGILNDISWLQKTILCRNALLLLSLIAFALSHIWFGLRETVYKLLLSVCALSLTIITMSLVPAIVMHIAYNTTIWRHNRQHGQQQFEIERHF